MLSEWDYVRNFNGYRQRTGPFRDSWCATLVQHKIQQIDDPYHMKKLIDVYDFLCRTLTPVMADLYGCKRPNSQGLTCTKSSRHHITGGLTRPCAKSSTIGQTCARTFWRFKPTVPVENCPSCTVLKQLHNKNRPT